MLTLNLRFGGGWPLRQQLQLDRVWGRVILVSVSDGGVFGVRRE